MATLNRRPSEYSLNDGRYRTDTVNFVRYKNGKWEIGTFDRGTDYDVRRYKTEEEACYAFLEDFYPEVLGNEG